MDGREEGRDIEPMGEKGNNFLTKRVTFLKIQVPRGTEFICAILASLLSDTLILEPHCRRGPEGQNSSKVKKHLTLAFVAGSAEFSLMLAF